MAHVAAVQALVREDTTQQGGGTHIPTDVNLNQLIREGHYESSLVQVQVCAGGLRMESSHSRLHALVFMQAHECVCVRCACVTAQHLCTIQCCHHIGVLCSCFTEHAISLNPHAGQQE